MCINSFKQHIVLSVSNRKAFYKLQLQLHLQLQTSKQWPNITPWKSFIGFHQADQSTIIFSVNSSFLLPELL